MGVHANVNVHATAYTFAQNVIFLSDNFRNSLREVIRENGLSPEKLMQDWTTIENGIQSWLFSRHLQTIVVEFYKPGAVSVSARWDFPISYVGLGVNDDMWPDKAYLRQLIAKSARPTTDCTYRVLLCKLTNAPYVPGFIDSPFLGTGQLEARQAGTIIAAGQLSAGATYWR
jgi:Bacterial HORMA domain 2